MVYILQDRATEVVSCMPYHKATTTLKNEWYGLGRHEGLDLIVLIIPLYWVYRKYFGQWIQMGVGQWGKGLFNSAL